MKNILIAIPTNKYIQPETFKAIYDLEIPEGYETHFQFFHGYQVDQIRNLISHWAKDYDFLFAVDSDISFPKNTLRKLLSHRKEIVTGLYVQRKPGHILEIYRNGKNIPHSDLEDGLMEIDSCGFGCVLVDANIIRKMSNPNFLYKSAIDHKDTVSEDTYFCIKAKAETGCKIYADTTIRCKHHGETVFEVPEKQIQESDDIKRLRELGNQRLLPKNHVDYLKNMSIAGVEPGVIYDIGACVLHWTKEAHRVWPNAKIIAFDAMDESLQIFRENGVEGFSVVLTDLDGRLVDFYQNTYHPGGNSYYQENAEVNRNAPNYFNSTHIKQKYGVRLDSLVASYKLPQPNLIKMDVQGAEMDVLKGAHHTLLHCQHLILELQKVEYNKGAPLKDEVIAYLETLGFMLIGGGSFSDNGPDGDYHFTKPFWRD